MRLVFLTVLLLSSAANAQVQKWEYAELRIGQTLSAKGEISSYCYWSGSLINPDEAVNISVPMQKYRGAILATSECLTKITGDKKYADFSIDNLVVQNILGAKGWELIQILNTHDVLTTPQGQEDEFMYRQFYKRLLN
jgi:hypothetical protein